MRQLRVAFCFCFLLYICVTCLSLTSLTQWENELGPEGVGFIADALKNNVSLKTLDLRDNRYLLLVLLVPTPSPSGAYF